MNLDPAIEVVATAKDPYEARDLILLHRPDVMTCDVEMPRMNGIEFIRRLLPQYAIPVIVVSTVSEAVLDAMEAGAIDFVVKPELASSQACGVIDSAAWSEKVSRRVVKTGRSSSAPGAATRSPSGKPSSPHAGIQRRRRTRLDLSTGGTEAIQRILSALPGDMPGMVIVQHIPPVFSRMYAERLNATTPFQVKEAVTGDEVAPGKVLMAPGDKHVRLRKTGGIYRVECFEGEANGHCPSVDALFENPLPRRQARRRSEFY